MNTRAETFTRALPKARASSAAAMNGIARIAGTSMVLLALALVSLPAAAEKTDREKPIRYSANSLDGNENDQSVILTGKVEILQGTIVLRADRVVLKQQPDGAYNATATGKPVTFRQKMDNSDEFVDAQALRIEYLGSKDLVELYDQGWIKRGKDELRGNFLTYNSSNGAFAGRGNLSPVQAGTGTDGRVSGVIQPKPPVAAPGAAPAAGATTTPLKQDAPATGARLQSAPMLANPPKE